MSALRELSNQGYYIPELPVVYINCENDKQAKDLLLRLNSQYGSMTKESVLDFIGDLDLDLSCYSLCNDVINFDIDNNFNIDDFFVVDTGKEQNEKPKILKCPHCGQIIEI